MKTFRHIFIAALCALALTAAPIAEALTPATSAEAPAPQKKKSSSTGRKSGSSGKKSSGSSSKKKGSATTAPTRSKSEVQNAKKRNTENQRETRRRIQANTRETERRLNQLNLLGGQIGECNVEISRLQAQVDSLNAAITSATDSILALDHRLNAITDLYVRSIRKAQGNKGNLSAMAFIFSSESFATAYRRVKALKQFGRWRDIKAAEIKDLRGQLETRREQLAGMQAAVSESMRRLGAERTSLQSKQAETNTLVSQLRKEGSQLQQVMQRQRNEAAALDAELDRIIAEEVRRQEEERRRKAEAEARARREREEAERKAREAEQARLRAEAERKAREEEEARKRAEQAAAEAAARKSDQEAQRRAKEAEKERKRAEAEAKKAREAQERQERENARREEQARKARESAGSLTTPTSPDAESGVASETVSVASSFAKCRGSLPFPVAGRYTIVKRFGRHPHPTLPHVETTNSGIDIETTSGATVRCVFDGEVSAVFRPDGYNNVVVVRHGDYTTVYANLGSLNVSSGDKVKAGQALGTVFTDSNDHNRSILHFEIRHLRQKEDPEAWLKK